MKFIRVLKSSLPNENSLGEPISNNPQALQNFWNWFKGSKVVDEQGRPLVVYHGTSEKGIQSFYDAGQIYFSEYRNIAETYGMGDYDDVTQQVKEPVIYSVYLVIKNPLNIRDLKSFKEVLDEINVHKDSVYKDMEQITNGLQFSDLDYSDQRQYCSMENFENITYTMLYLTHQQDLIKYAKSKGYDGIFDLEQGGYGGASYNGFIIFNPNQVKSISNNSNYNKEDNNIYGGMK